MIDGKDLLIVIYRRERAPVWCLVDDDSLSGYLFFYIEKRQCSYHALYSKPPTLTYMDQSFGSYNFFFCAFFSYLYFDHTHAMVNLPVQSKFNIGEIRYFVRLVTTTDRRNKRLFTCAPLILLNLSFAYNKKWMAPT